MDIGAGWINKDKNGKSYLSVQIEYPGMKLNAAMFKNEQKEKESQPDYRVIWSAPRKKNNGVETTDFDDDILF